MDRHKKKIIGVDFSTCPAAPRAPIVIYLSGRITIGLVS